MYILKTKNYKHIIGAWNIPILQRNKTLWRSRDIYNSSTDYAEAKRKFKLWAYVYGCHTWSTLFWEKTSREPSCREFQHILSLGEANQQPALLYNIIWWMIGRHPLHVLFSSNPRRKWETIVFLPSAWKAKGCFRCFIVFSRDCTSDDFT